MAEDKHRVALVTGGMGGLGEAICLKLAALGYTVVTTHSPGNTRAQEWLDGMKRQGYSFHAYPCDVIDWDSCVACAANVTKDVGPVDVLINNAGIAGLTLPVADYPPDDWDKVVAVNLTAMFDVSRLAIPHLKKSKAGCIINMSSIAGRYGFPNRSPYAATKWGVIGLTKTLAMELGEWGIRANAIAPGAVEGERIVRVFQGRAQISGRSLDEVKADALAAASIKAMIDPRDIAQLAVFLASDAAKSISGQVIPIDNDRQKA
jgi:NAD(P)-dependent dehydrogenase (short-subunit alcohol dehydrogenase family)